MLAFVERSCENISRVSGSQYNSNSEHHGWYLSRETASMVKIGVLELMQKLQLLRKVV